MQGAARARAPLLIKEHAARLRLRPNQALASGLCFVCTAQDASSASLATLVARQSLMMNGPSDLQEESNHFKIGEINDQNFAAMPENRR